MAGIGFDLRHTIETRPGVMTKVRAYASASLISSGPWIVTMVTLLVVSLTSESTLAEGQAKLFRSLVTYAFAFSLLTVGTVQMAFTRYVSDVLYSGKHEEILATYTTALRATGLFQAITALGFCYCAGFPPNLSFIFTSLYVVISATWLAVSWLTVIRQYDQILLAYLAGMGVSITAMSMWSFDVESSLAAYVLGQGLTLGLLNRLIIRGTNQSRVRDSKILNSLRRYPDLVGVGLFYSGAIWIDKMMFWFRDGVAVHPWICYHPLYDTCCFLGYLTVVPAMAINLVHFETSFYEHHRAYYAAILSNMPLREIEWRRREMVACLRDGTVRLLRMQGWITAAAILFAQPVMEFFGMPEGAVRVFRVAALGAFFHVLLLVTVLVQLYFDLRREALFCSAVFFVANGALTWISMDLGIAFYGTGYTLAALGSLLLAFTMLVRSLGNLEFLTFSRLTAAPDAEEA